MTVSETRSLDSVYAQCVCKLVTYIVTCHRQNQRGEGGSVGSQGTGGRHGRVDGKLFPGYVYVILNQNKNGKAMKQLA